MRAQVKHSLDKAYDLYPYLRRLPRSEHTKTSVAVGRIEYQVCMEQFLKHDNSKHRSDSHPAR